MPTVKEVLQQAVALQSQGKNREAAAYYEAVLKVEPTNADALHLLGLVASSEKDYRRAEDLIRKALDIAPSSPVFHSNLGIILRFSDRIDEAIVVLEGALQRFSDDPEILYALVTFNRDAGKREAAHRYARQLKALLPDNPQIEELERSLRP